MAVDYTNANLAEVVGEETGGIGVDAVLDTVGGDTILSSIKRTRPFGRMATILGAQGDLTPMYQKNRTLYGVLLTCERARLDEMTKLVERGLLKPLVEVLPLDDVDRAHERLESGHGLGKTVLRVAQGSSGAFGGPYRRVMIQTAWMMPGM